MPPYSPKRTVVVAGGANDRGEPVDRADGERPESAEEGPDEAVAGEHRRPLLVRDDMGDHGVFERQEDAHVAAGRVQRSDERDHEQRPEAFETGKAQSRRRHQETRGEQGPTPRNPVGDQPDGQRQQGGAQQCRGRDDPDTEGIVAEAREMERQQDRDVAVAEGPQGPRPENPPDVRRQDLARAGPGTRSGSGIGFDGAAGCWHAASPSKDRTRCLGMPPRGEIAIPMGSVDARSQWVVNGIDLLPTR